MDSHSPAPTQPDRNRDMLVVVAAAVLVALTVIVPALVPAPHPAVSPTLATFANDSACLEWTDSCVVCTRTDTGQACSTPGIACQASEPRCLRRKGG